MVTGEIQLTDLSDLKIVENCIADFILLFKERYYQLSFFYVKVEQFEKLDNLLFDVSLSYVTTLPALFCVYSFDYLCDTLSVSVPPRVSAENVTTIATGGMTVSCLVLNNCVEELLLGRHHRSDVIRQADI